MVETRKKILCVEDDREAAALIAEDLIDRGFDVSIACDGQDGLNKILIEKPDLVICDVNLPILTGFQVAERLVTVAPHLSRTPFVFLTAMSDRLVETEARKHGTYVTKPIDFDVLGLVIARRLGDATRGQGAQPVIGREVEGAAW
jgi:DNA-binding response OmpR family regulator